MPSVTNYQGGKRCREVTAEQPMVPKKTVPLETNSLSRYYLIENITGIYRSEVYNITADNFFQRRISNFPTCSLVIK